MVACFLKMYSTIGHRPANSKASSVDDHSHPPSPLADISSLQSAEHMWWNLVTMLVGWLILLPPGVGCYIMGYESDPLPSYRNLRNFSHSIQLNYTTSSSNPQFCLPRPGTTIAPTGSFLASSPPLCTYHIWGSRPLFTLWLPSDSWYTPRWGGTPHIPLPPLPRGTTTLQLPRISPSSQWSVAPPGGGTPPEPLASSPSPPSYCCRTIAPTVPPPYTLLPGPAPLLLSFPEPLLPFPTASELSASFGRPPPNCCYCRQFSVLSMENPLTMVGFPHLYETY